MLLRSVAAAALTLSLLAPRSQARIEIPNAAQPQLTASSDGRVWLVYGQTETAAATTSHDTAAYSGKHASHGAPAASRPAGALYVASSKNGGVTFTPEHRVGAIPGLMLGMRRGPRIAVHGDRLTITAVGEELYAFTSTDGGETWTAPVTINDVPKSAAEGLHDLAVAPNGALFATWLDIRSGRMELWAAESADSGKTWSKDQRVYASPDKSICECCHPNALFDAQGNLAVMWRNSIEGSRDMWMAVRANGAKEFSAAKKVGEGTWKLNVCPMDGGKIVALDDGDFAAVWQRAGEVFFARLGEPEIVLGKGKQPVGFISRGELVVLWQEGTDLVALRNPGKGIATKLASDARFAVAVTLPGNNGALVAYERGAPQGKQPGLVIDQL